MSRLIWIYAVCKSQLLSPVAVKELAKPKGRICSPKENWLQYRKQNRKLQVKDVSLVKMAENYNVYLILPRVRLHTFMITASTLSNVIDVILLPYKRRYLLLTPYPRLEEK